MSVNEIRYLRREQIDVTKWNECIQRSQNGLIYGTAVYLDSLCSWDGLILDDYDAVMPLPWRRKYGFHYLYQPFFCQQLGVFTKLKDDTLTDQFLRSIPARYSFWDIHLNAANTSTQFIGKMRKNYLLSLDKAYPELQNLYSRSAKRNIAKAVDAGITITENITPGTVIHLHNERFENKIGIDTKAYHNFAKLLSTLHTHQQVFLAAAKNNKDEIIASSVYLLFKNRLTFVLNGNLPESLQNGATHCLKDYVIRKFQQSDFWMDFEGSDDPDFARFYEQFGARKIEHYLAIRNNKLPWPVKLLKRTID